VSALRPCVGFGPERRIVTLRSFPGAEVSFGATAGEYVSARSPARWAAVLDRLRGRPRADWQPGAGWVGRDAEPGATLGGIAAGGSDTISLGVGSYGPGDRISTRYLNHTSSTAHMQFNVYTDAGRVTGPARAA
jgi:hypothetical protein